MDGDHPTTVGGVPLATGMATIMATAMHIPVATGPGIMQAGALLMADQHLTPTGPGPQTMYITIAPRVSEGQGTIHMMPGQETGLQQMTVRGPLHSPPTGPTISIPTEMEMYIVRMETTLTG